MEGSSLSATVKPGPGDFSLTIGGKLVDGSSTFSVVNPVTGESESSAPECSIGQLDLALTEAQAAFPGWARDADRRCDLMLKLADAIDDAADELTSLVMLETGKPRMLAATEPGTCAAWLRYYSGVDIPRVRMQEDAGGYIDVAHRPLGVVAAITPWNFPLVLAVWKVAPALRAGNVVVLKPSPFTPFATLRLGEIANEILPPGVVSVVSGGDDLGRALTAHPVPRKVTFTGSIAAGKSVAVSAAADLKRVTLELGGNDAAIILRDADLSKAVPVIAAMAFMNAGQACALPKRIFVHESIYDDAVEAFVAAAEGMRSGMTTSDDRTFGPLTTRPQYDRVCSLLESAKSQGATVACGGETDALGGFFVSPTILTDAHEGQAVVDEEQFGPLLPILSYQTIDEAVNRSNDTMYGLAGSVWGSDVDQAREVAERLECGAVWVNNHAALAMTVPFGGQKWSGVGVENGVDGLLQFTDAQAIYVPRQ